MESHAFCRIGIFYDGCYFMYAQRFFWHQRKIGWLDFHAFHKFIENYVRLKEQGYFNYRIVYAAWFQGMFPTNAANDKQLKFDRNFYHDLMHAGIEPKYFPVSQTGNVEKGADVAFAIDAMQIGLEGKLDIAVLVTGDGDFVPLVRALMKQGIRVMAAYFEYEEPHHKSFINERLLAVCNYDVNINALEQDKNFTSVFRSLFRRIESPKTSS